MRPQRAGGAESPAEMQLDKWTIEGKVNEDFLQYLRRLLALQAENVLAFS